MASSNGNRGDATKIEKLDGTNYLTWKNNMKLVLMERGLWGYVDGHELKPKETDKADKKEKYLLNRDKAYSIMALAVEDALQIHIVNTTDPKEAWEILHDQFAFVSVTQIVRVTQKFYSASMQEGDDLMQHITTMTTYAQQLRDLNEHITPQKFATVMLGSLPPSYDTFITSLNARNADDLNWDLLKGALIEEYLNRKDKYGGQGGSQRNDALFTRSGYRNNSTQNQQYRQRDNTYNSQNQNQQHRQQRDNSNNRNGGGRGRGPTCYNCGDVGHIARNCRNNNSNNTNHNNNNNNNNNNMSGSNW